MEFSSGCETVTKVWGYEEIWVNQPGLYCLKTLNLLPGYVCSEHRHLKKDETFLCDTGKAFVSVDGEIRWIEAQDKVRVPPGSWHFFGTVNGATFLEVSTEHSDDDVERRTESHRVMQEDDPDLWEVMYR